MAADTIPFYLEKPAETVPTFKDTAAEITGQSLGSVDIAKRVVDMAPPAPTNEELRAARQKAADKAAENRRKQVSFDESFKAEKDAYTLAAQQYAEDAKNKLPKQRTAPPQPGRGLQPFLASTKDDPIENVIGKFMQTVSLFATMAGGGRAGARASLSALTGALEGWQAGNRYKADKEYAAWKDATETMFRSFDDEMRGYNSLMIAERVPLEQKLRAMELHAREHNNAMIAGEMEAASYEKAAVALERAKATRIDLEKWYAGIVGGKEEADRRFYAQEKQFLLTLNQRGEALDLKRQLGELQLAVRAAGVDAKAQAAAEGRPTPPGQMTKLEDIANAQTYIAEMKRLADRVDLNKLAGGLRPWINQVIQTGKLGSMPVTIGTLTEDERRFLALTQDYTDVILRQRSGAAINESEFQRMLQFVPDQSVTPDTLRTRLKLAEDINRTKGELMRRMLTGGGYRAPNIELPSMAPTQSQSAPAPGSKREGNDWVSESGAYVWRDGAWIAR